MSNLLRLFPLEVVLFPGMPLPLHIFEPRYKQMIGECLLERAPFGVVLENAGQRAEFGCSAEIVQQVQRYPDGRMDILAEGRQRFRLLALDEAKPYLRARVEWLEDPEEDLSAARIEVLELYRQTYWGHGQGLSPSMIESAPRMSYAVARSNLMDLSDRQQLLETTGEKERLEVLAVALRELEPVVRKLSGNGHSPKA